jgi:hypothetical protein
METPEPPGVVSGLTHEERIDEFLRLLSQGCRVRDAASSVSLAFSGLYNRRRTDPAFAKRWEDATRVKVEHLVAEAERRAMAGSDKILMFLLSSYAPEKFKQRTALEHQGALSLQVVTGLPDTVVDDLL